MSRPASWSFSTTFLRLPPIAASPTAGHETEPGCAVRAAVEAGTLDAERLNRFRKLAAEDAHNSETLAARRAREKGFGKMIKAVIKEKKGRWE